MDGEAHCINYKVGFKHEDFETVKVYNEENGRSKKCIVFTDEHGIEGLLYVEARFRKIAEKFEFEGPQLFDAFEEVLQGTALTNWEQLADEVEEDDRTQETFDEIMVQYYADYCDENARDTMYDYLKNKCKKPVGEEPRIHVRRMELLYSYAAKLPGMEAIMTSDQIKRAIFKTFPETWRKQYMRSGKSLQENTMQDVITFMQNEKAYADEEKGKKRNTEDNQQMMNKKAKKNKETNKGNPNQNGKITPNDPCPHHYGHKWSECYDNPRGTNYRPRNKNQHQQGQNRNTGRGGQFGNFRNNFQGRGGANGGRGNQFQGRGGRGHLGPNQMMHQNNNNNNNYHFEQGRDPNRGQGQGNEANPRGQHTQRDQNPQEQHYFDQVGMNAWGQE